MSAPASKPEAKSGHTFRKFKDGDHEWARSQEQIFSGDETDKCPTYVHKTPPCQASCPSGEDIRGWLNIVRGVEKAAQGHEHAGVRVPPLHRRQSVSRR